MPTGKYICYGPSRRGASNEYHNIYVLGGIRKISKWDFAQHVANGGDQCLNFTVFTVCIRTDRPEQTV